MKNKNRFYVASICLAFVLFQNKGYGQNLGYPIKRSPIKSFAATVGGDVLHVFSAPLRMSPKSGLQLLVFAAVTTGFVTVLDRRIDENFIEGDDAYVKPAKELAKLGNGYDKISSKYILAGISASMLTGGLVFNDKKLLKTTRLMVESFLIAGAITGLGKGIFGRARPYTGKSTSNFDFFRFSRSKDYRSFPSGHVTSAFSMMTVLAKQYDPWWIKIPAYAVAVSVAMQRIDSRNHWGADVVVGGAIGYWVGNTLVNRNKNKSKNPAFNAYFFGNSIGLMINF